jgi:putative transposase
VQQIEPLTIGHYYHIYNRGINSCDLFHSPDNFRLFLKLYDKYISPIADTFVWVLMGNHFHFLIWLKEEPDLTGSDNLSGLRSNLQKPPHQHFSNLFNAYSKVFNKRFNRHGALFERPFKRKLIDNQMYLKQAVLYIHNNPVHHGFCQHPIEYLWSSYETCISKKQTKIHRNTVIDWFDNIENFIYMHNQKLNTEMIEEWLES